MALAVLELARGQTMRADRLARQALEPTPAPAARLLSDASAIESALGGILSEPERWARAAHLADQAIALDPDLVEARFNLAVALQSLGLEWPAMRAWRDYRRRDEASAWSQEAEERLAGLQRRSQIGAFSAAKIGLTAPAATAYSNETILQYTKSSALATWTAFEEILRDSHGQPSPSDVELTGALATSYREVTGDGFLTDVHATLQPLSTSTRPLQLLLEGKHSYAEFDYEAARASFAEAIASTTATSPVGLWARYQNAITAFQLKRFADFGQEIDLVLAASRAAQYVTLEANCLTWRALRHHVQRQYARARILYGDALMLRQRAGLHAEAAVAATNLSRVWWEIGSSSRAWQLLALALGEAGAEGEPKRSELALSWGTKLAKEQGYLGLAEHFLEAQLHVSQNVDDPVNAADLWEQRAELARQAGDYRATLEHLRRARRQNALVTSQAIRQHQAALMNWTEGAVLTASDPRAASVVLSRALDFFDQNEFAYLRTAILTRRARARLSMGDEAGALLDLEQAASAFERERRELAGSPSPPAFLSESEAVHEDWIQLLLRAGEVKQALTVAERSRVWVSSPAEPAGDTSDTNDGAAARMALDVLLKSPAITTVVVIEQLADRIVIWVVAKGELTSNVARIDRSEAQLMARPGMDTQANALFGRLVEALALALDGKILPGESVTWAEDAELTNLPWVEIISALEDRLHTPLRPIHVPGLRAHLAFRDLPRSRPRPSVLVVADALTADRDLSLPPLPQAARDAGVIAAMYGKARVLRGEEALKSELLRNWTNFDVLHFAVHAVSNPWRPGWSYLVLRDAQGAPEPLTVDEISATRLDQHPIVVLAGCSTASVEGDAANGVQGLESAFLAAGARLVLSNYGPVSDLEASAHSLAVHRFLVGVDHLDIHSSDRFPGEMRWAGRLD